MLDFLLVLVLMLLPRAETPTLKDWMREVERKHERSPIPGMRVSGDPAFVHHWARRNGEVVYAGMSSTGGLSMRPRRRMGFLPGCGCGRRKQELRDRGIRPLVGKSYTPLDFFRWLVLKANARNMAAALAIAAIPVALHFGFPHTLFLGFIPLVGCTGTGNCFWVGGTGNFSDSTHWATTSGGAVTGGLPASTDAVTFDGSSGAGTATNDTTTFQTGAVIMTNSSVAVSGSSNLWKVGGNWQDGNKHFSKSTSTIEITVTSTFNPGPGGGAATYHNVTVDAGATITQGDRWGFDGVFTVNGTWNYNGNFLDVASSTQNNPFSFGANGSQTGTTVVSWVTSAAITVNIPARTDWSTWRLQPLAAGVTYSLGSGSTTVAAIEIRCGGGTFVFNSNGNSLTVTTTLSTPTDGACGMATAASAILITGAVTLGPSVYVTTSAGGSWTTPANWTNNSTSTSWAFNGQLVLSGSGAQTIAGTGTKNVFGSIQFTGSGQKNFTVNFTSGSMTATLAVTIQVTNTATWTVTSGSNIGDPNLGITLTIKSDVSGTPFSMSASSAVMANFVNVRDSNNSGTLIDARNSVDSTGNTGWEFYPEYNETPHAAL